MPAVLEQIFEDLNSYSETSIPLDGFNSLELKLFPFYRGWCIRPQSATYTTQRTLRNARTGRSRSDWRLCMNYEMITGTSLGRG
jgi:hypothetical protein